jgi:hypothetical protein
MVQINFNFCKLVKSCDLLKVVKSNELAFYASYRSAICAYACACTEMISII